MPRIYEHPPIVEALTSFRFESSSPWDWTIPGLLYGKIGKEFPTKREQTANAEVAVRDEGSPSGATIERMQFLSPDESTVVQIAPNVLTISRRSNYPGWPAFRKLVLRQLSTYLQVSKDTMISGVALSYLNRLEVPSSTFELEEYFNVLPGLPLELDLQGEVGEFFIDTALHFQDPELRIRLRFGSAASEDDNENNAPFTMQLNAGSPDSARFQYNDVRSWLDKAHERIEAVFDASFTDRAHKELFGEVVSRT